MESLSAPFLAAIGANVTQPLLLVEVLFSAPLRVSSAGTLSWDSRTWLGASLRVDGIGADGGGGGGCQIIIGNADNEIGALMQNEGIADRAIGVWEAWLDPDGVTVHVKQAYAGAGGAGRIGQDVATIAVVAADTAHLHAPREMISAAYGFTHLRPPGAEISWNGSKITTTRRLGGGA